MGTRDAPVMPATVRRTERVLGDELEDVAVEGVLDGEDEADLLLNRKGSAGGRARPGDAYGRGFGRIFWIRGETIVDGESFILEPPTRGDHGARRVARGSRRDARVGDLRHADVRWWKRTDEGSLCAPRDGR